MYSRLDDMPVFERRQSSIKAYYYNHVHIALNKLGNEIRLSLPKLQHLNLILQKNAWIITDTQLNDMPIAAWTDFEVEHRDNLYKDIPCQLKLYHMHANLILDRTLEAMELLLGEELEKNHILDKASVLPLRKK